jgi:asparagine synthetase B (glutamine-hydrolysing)
MLTKENGLKFKELLLKKVKAEAEKHDDFAILFSGGVDSCMVLFACLELGIKPKCYTFGVEGYDSGDVETSKAMCEHFGVDHEVIMIPVDVKQLEKDVRYLIEKYGQLKKTTVQCLFPFLYMMPQVKEKAVFLGLLSDVYFICGRKAKYVRDSKEKFDEIRKSSVYSITDELSQRYCEEEHGVAFVDIFLDDDMFDFAMQFDWRELNTPKEKYLAYLAFEEYFEAGEKFFRKHSSYQIESGLREYHDLLLQQPHLNVKGHKAIIGIYNYIYKQMHENTEIKQRKLF